jgi:hypothetical protein
MFCGKVIDVEMNETHCLQANTTVVEFWHLNPLDIRNVRKNKQKKFFTQV